MLHKNAIRFIIHTDTNRIADNTSTFSTIAPYVGVAIFICLAAAIAPVILSPNPRHTSDFNPTPTDIQLDNIRARNRAVTPDHLPMIIDLQTRNNRTGEILANPNPVGDSNSEIWEDIDLGGV